MPLELRLHQREKAAELIAHDRLGQRVFPADLVVHLLSAHPDIVGQPRHGEAGPPMTGRAVDGGGEDAVAQRRHRESVIGNPSRARRHATALSKTKSVFSRTPQSGHDQSAGMRTHGVPAGKPSRGSPRSGS